MENQIQERDRLEEKCRNHEKQVECFKPPPKPTYLRLIKKQTADIRKICAQRRKKHRDRSGNRVANKMRLLFGEYTNCLFGCETKETIEHVFTCPKNAQAFY